MRNKIGLCYIGYLSTRASSSSSPSSSAAKKRHPSGTRPPRPPFYRSTHPYIPLGTKLDEFPNAGETDGSGPRLYDYWKVGEMVRQLPTVSEKIDFVNPYERPWTKFEEKWDHHPPLIPPRKAWNVFPIPKYFDSLDFYKYITKTRVIDGMDICYRDLNPPTNSFEVSRINLTLDFTKEKNTFLLRNVVDAAVSVMSRNVHQLHDCNVIISYFPRCESFWIRSGFRFLYDSDREPDKVEDIRRKRRFPGDDIRQLGELAFVLRDDLVVQVRDKQPLTPVFPFSDEEELFYDVLYAPQIFNLLVDDQPLWQCPGYEPDCGDPNKFGRVAFKDITPIWNFCDWWKVDGEEKEQVVRDCLTATSVVSLFSWLNGQAHALGHTQYTDIEQPLVSQLVLSDGQNFFFALAQLNTIAINVDGFINDRCNVCYVEGPFRLYDIYQEKEEKFLYFEGGKQIEGLNPHILQRLLQMFIRD
ncbi:unnamed protein product [Enterobius vermicularis]|uniref:28S ribosomal protein S30, mitochondrial n=1 Tax=Enterobius vermicularis TaxID=51028 RepID=A0A0N4V7M0_ENTVE|nr:unnamed protein product [Enterobius vermicularis]